ncbi:unnamed protein product, partial [Mesorhabditis spiculigera]
VQSAVQAAPHDSSTGCAGCPASGPCLQIDFLNRQAPQSIRFFQCGLAIKRIVGTQFKHQATKRYQGYIIRLIHGTPNDCKMHRVTADNLERSIFTSSRPEDKLHFCVVAFSKTFAATYNHGPHENLVPGRIVNLFNVRDPSLQIETRVRGSSNIYDVTVLETVTDEFPHYPRSSGTMFGGQSYRQLGVTSDRTLTWKDGVISERRDMYAIGSGHGKSGDSGSGVYSTDGLFLEIADHHPDTQMISAELIKVVGNIVPDAKQYGPS